MPSGPRWRPRRDAGRGRQAWTRPHAVVEAAHAELLARFGAADAVAFHGQTLAHDPGGRGTHQAGDGARLAALTGRTVVWDFRSADVAAGGEGAPLAPFYHCALARWLGAEAPMAVLNLGGVANVTWIDPTAAAPEAPGALIACDTGPANAPIDDLVRARTGADCDRDGALARAGRVDRAILDRFRAEPFLAARRRNRSTGGRLAGSPTRSPRYRPKTPPRRSPRSARPGWRRPGRCSPHRPAA
jgi:1,6-anhydro-N-acetylmuramate kinase